MGRKNIFEILAEKEDIAYQLDRIETLLSKHSIDGWTLEEILMSTVFEIGNIGGGVLVVEK